MRVVAAVPAIGLLLGAACGLVLSELPHFPLYSVLIACGGLAVWAWHRANGRALAIAVAAGFFCGGTLLAADAWQRAWRPTLRIAFEQLAREQRAEAAAAGR